MVKTHRILYMEEYRCGCSNVGYRGELPGYCPAHGENRRRRSPRVRIGYEHENPDVRKGLAK
jgi:hypothetical protein